MDTVFAQLITKTRDLSRQLTKPWGLCERPENSDWTCDERVICCKGICGRWRVVNLFRSEICGKCEKIVPG